jgi:hypothetical protein
VIAALLVGGCIAGCGAKPTGTVVGYFRLPERPAVDRQRGGLNFSVGTHGREHGHTTAVGPGGRYSVTLLPGSYSVVGGLSGHPGGPAPERCAATIHVVVRAHHTTRADYVCHATPVPAP